MYEVVVLDSPIHQTLNKPPCSEHVEEYHVAGYQLIGMTTSVSACVRPLQQLCLPLKLWCAWPSLSIDPEKGANKPRPSNLCPKLDEK